MDKNVRLVNIYIKIHNRNVLTMDDLAFLAEHDPECFAKTCHNLVYNIPAAKTLMQPEEEPAKAPVQEPEIPVKSHVPVLSERTRIESFLANLKKMERHDLQVQEVSAEQVKSLMGNLYMEMMFPHNDMATYFDIPESVRESVFNKRV